MIHSLFFEINSKLLSFSNCNLAIQLDNLDIYVTLIQPQMYQTVVTELPNCQLILKK